MHALVHRRQEPAAPGGFSGIGVLAARGKDDEPGEVGVLGAQSVRDPGPQAGPSEPGGAGLHEQLGRGVVELVGMHRFEESELVGYPGEVGQVVGYPGTALAVLLEFALAAQHLRHPADESEFFPFQQGLRTGLPVQLFQFGLVVEEFQLRRGTGHVQVDDRFGSCRKMRCAGR